MREEFVQELEAEAKKLESRRKRAKSLFNVYACTVVLISKLAMLGLFVFAIIGLLFPPFLIHALICLVITIALSFIPNPKQRYEEHIKRNLIPKIMKEIFPDLTYTPDAFRLDLMKKSGLFASRLFSNSSRIYGEDQVEGTIQDIEVSFSEVWFFSRPINWGKTFLTIAGFILILPLLIIFFIWRAIAEGDADFGGDSESDFSLIVREEINFYKGLFLYADFHKDFRGQLVMIPKALSKRSENFQRFSDFGSLKEVHLEHALISDAYRVLSNDEQMAFYTMSTSLIEHIVQIIQTEDVLPIFTLSNGKMYMTIPWDKDYFSVSIKTKVTGSEYFTKYIREIESFEKILVHLKQNVRIWTKE